MFCCLNIKKIIYFFIILIIVFLGGVCLYTYADDEIQTTEEKKYIKWVDFNIPYEALEKAMNIDIKSQKDEVKLRILD